MACKFCKKKLNLKRKIYCNNKCQANLKYKLYIENWLKGKISGLRGKFDVSKHVRRYLFELNNDSCQKCRWNKLNVISKLCPLEVHHIDGNLLNNILANLELLCPNCHSLTENYKALNSKSKRIDRK